jgi:hypothetical protein
VVVGDADTITNGSRNGVNGHVPRTPSLSGLSLTEYSANPSTPSESAQNRIKDIVPDEFILPNGHPDVGLPAYRLIDPLCPSPHSASCHNSWLTMAGYAVPPLNPHLPCLRSL